MIRGEYAMVSAQEQIPVDLELVDDDQDGWSLYLYN